MSYLSIEQVLRLKNPERAHVRKVDEALHELLTRNLTTASLNKLDEDLIAQATMTLVLANAAREALALCERQKKPFSIRAFSKHAREVAGWAMTRHRDGESGKAG
jgi:hypothetical protein